MNHSQTYPITPDGLASPCPQCKGSVASESPHGRLPHGIPETCVWKQVCGVGDLESQQVRLESVGCGRVLLHAICDQVAGMYNVLLASLESDLVDLTFATQGKEATTGSVSVTPVGNALIESVLFRSDSVFISLTMLVFTRGDKLNVCPVHANSAFLCVTIQSSLPSRCTMTIEVIADFVEIKAV